MRCLSRVSIHEVKILDMPSPCRDATKLRKVTLSKAPIISRKIPKVGFFPIRQWSTRRTNSCKAVSVATPARKPYCDAESFACTLLSSLIWYRTSFSNHFSWKEVKVIIWAFLSRFGEKYTCAFFPCQWHIAVSQACLKNDMVISFQLIPTFL